MRNYGYVQDDYGNTYKTVIIGDQTWMAENLKYNAPGSKCYAEGSSGVSADSVAKNCEKYGRLYDWATAMGEVKDICPDGWHIPSSLEWTQLYHYVDDTAYKEANYDSPIAGRYLKATSGWNSNGNGEDAFGFAALPGGNYNPSGGGSFSFQTPFSDAGDRGYWWSSTERSSSAYLRIMYYNRENANFNYDDKNKMLSIRCIQGDGPSRSSSSSSRPLSSSSSNPHFSDKGNNIANYEIKEIGEQWWMAENLNYNVPGSKCYAEGISGVSADSIAKNCEKYGRLYDWATTMDLPSKCNSVRTSRDPECATNTPHHRGVCPANWHIPSNAEWDQLFRYTDGNISTNSPYASPTAGWHLKATSGWNNHSGEQSGNGEDAFGFAALPSGRGIYLGLFYEAGSAGYWWSSSEYTSSTTHSRSMNNSIDYGSWTEDRKSDLFSVRCVRD
jgi:uncharacterized protein (TIGR02145 family)